MLVEAGRGDRFFYDEWGWVELRRSGLSAILDSYNQHMEIVPLAVYQLLFHTIGLAHYRWYRLLATLGHLALVSAVYLYARSRIGALALVVVVPLAFLGAGWEFILWGINFGFTTSIALAVAALVWLEEDRRSSLPAALLLLGSLLFSETALLFAVGLGFELTWRDRGLRRAWVWATPVVLYLIWYAAFYSSYLGANHLGAVFTFGPRLAAAAAGGLIGVDQIGGTFGAGATVGWVLLGLIAVVIAVRVLTARAFGPRLLCVLVVALGYWALVAFGRAQIGAPESSRYVYVGAVFLLLILLEALRGIRTGRGPALVAVAVAALATVGGLSALSQGALTLGEGSHAEAAQLTALSLVGPSATPADQGIDPHWSPMIIPALYFPAAASLGGGGALSLTQLEQETEVSRAAADFVLVGTGELTVGHPPAQTTGPATTPTVEFRLAGALTRRRGCVRFAPAGYGSTLDVGLPSSGLEISTSGRPVRRGAPPTEVRVRRFGSGFENPPVASLVGAGSIILRARPDRAALPWHVRISPWRTVTACTLSG